MKTLFVLAGAAIALSACAEKSAYESAVENLEPRYCYQSIGGVTCYQKPFVRDERRLVNYYGPAPQRYDRPVPAPGPVTGPPESVAYWVKDPEPVPTVPPRGDLADRPWLQKTPVQLYDPDEDMAGVDAFLQEFDASSAPSSNAARHNPEVRGM